MGYIYNGNIPPSWVWKVILVENSKSLLQFSRNHKTTCAASTNLVITPSSEVEKTNGLLDWNLDLMDLPTMYIVHHESWKIGTCLHKKLNHLWCDSWPCARNLSQLGKQLMDYLLIPIYPYQQDAPLRHHRTLLPPSLPALRIAA
jgi:hypothetical protein